MNGTFLRFFERRRRLTQNPIFFRRLALPVDARPGTPGPLLRAFLPATWHAARLRGAVSGRTTKPGRAGGRRRGTGLVEVLVALSLALVLIVGAAEMLTLALAAKMRADVTAALTHALGDRLESLKSRPFDDPALVAGEYAETCRAEPGRALVAATWRIEDEADGIKKVTLRVRYATKPGPAMTAAAYILRDLGFKP